MLSSADGSCRTDRTLAAARDWDLGMPYTRADLLLMPCPLPSE